MILRVLFTISISIFFISCGSSTNINLAKYKQNINKKLTIDPICKDLYIKEKPRVAVVNFTNNSNFTLAKTNDKYSDTYIGIGITPIGIGAGANSSKSNTSRVVDPKLASAFIPLIEQMVINTGGAKLFTRSDLNKVDTELKLQDSGLLDPNSIVEFGLNSGVQYIITGSIDYVEHNFKNYSKYTKVIANASMHSDNTNLKLATSAAHLVSSFFDGTTIKSAVTVKIIDVATAEIIFSKQIKSETKLKSKRKPTYGELVGAVKSSINKALPSLQNELSKQFSIMTYINKIKKYDDDIIVQLNAGSNNKIKEGDKFKVLDIEVTTNPLNNQKTCDTFDTNIIIQASQHINKTKTWAKVISGDKDNVKLLQLVKKIKD